MWPTQASFLCKLRMEGERVRENRVSWTSFCLRQANAMTLGVVNWSDLPTPITFWIHRFWTAYCTFTVGHIHTSCDKHNWLHLCGWKKAGIQRMRERVCFGGAELTWGGNFSRHTPTSHCFEEKSGVCGIVWFTASLSSSYWFLNHSTNELTDTDLLIVPEHPPPIITSTPPPKPAESII